MEEVEINHNAKMKRDDDGFYWLIIETSIGLSAMYSLSIIKTNPETEEGKNIGFDDVLEAFMKDQKMAASNR